MKNFTNISTQDTENVNIYIILLKSLIMCFILSLAMVVVYALMLSYSSISDESMSKITQFILIINITISGIYGGRKIKRKGWFFGALLGLLFIILLIPITTAFGKTFVFDTYFILKMLMGSAVGLIGGVIGVNLS